MKSAESYKDLIAWRKAVTLAGAVYAVTRLLPNDERFGLRAQIRRAAISVPSNIAEGAARRNLAEFLQFLHIARGSLAELDTQMLIAVEQGFIPATTARLEDIAELGRILNGLITKLAASRRAAHADACAPNPKRGSRESRPDPATNK